jgi:ribosomal-protein-alanine N-acetyltransferase
MIRPFVLSDLDRIVEIEQQSFPKSPYPASAFLHLYWLHPKGFLVYVGPSRTEREGEIFGYLVFAEDGHLISLAVHPQHRRKGIARALVEKTKRVLPGKKLWAEVRQTNQGAFAFYEKLGFQMVGTLFNYYGGEDALVIQWAPPYLRKAR